MPSLTKRQWGKVLSAVMVLIIAMMPACQAQAPTGPQPAATMVLGQTFDSLIVRKDLTVRGPASFTSLSATTIVSQAVGFDTTGDGTAAAPAYTFLSDPNTGMYNVAANDIGLSTNGVLRFDVSTTAATSSLPIAHPAGTAAAPSIYITGDTNTGLYQVAADDVGISAGGTLRFDVSATAATAAVPVIVPVGSAAAPAVAFTGDTNTGLYNVGANDIGISTNGVLAFDVSATAATFALPAVIPAGTVSAPGLALAGDLNTGLYAIGANNIGVATNGVIAMDASATAVTFGLPAVIPAGTVSAPGLALAGDLNTGLYAIGANNIGVATNGVIAMDASAAAITFGLPVHGPAEGAVVYNTQHDVTAAEINTGHTIITVPAARTFRLVNANATAYGATCTTSTSVLVKAGTVTLVTYTVANLVRSTLLDLTATGVTLVADGASFAVQAAGDDVTVISNSADTAGCTGVRFAISYVLE